MCIFETILKLSDTDAGYKNLSTLLFGVPSKILLLFIETRCDVCAHTPCVQDLMIHNSSTPRVCAAYTLNML